jgi:hypothetical protein
MPSTLGVPTTWSYRGGGVAAGVLSASGLSDTNSGAGGGALSSSKAGGLKLGTRIRWMGRAAFWMPSGSTGGGFCIELAGFIFESDRWAACGGAGIPSVPSRPGSVPVDELGEGPVIIEAESAQPQAEWYVAG